MIRIHLLIYFLALGSVLLGYSSQLHHVICFTWLRATLHCAAQFGLSASLWEYLPLFDLVFRSSRRVMCVPALFPHHTQFRTCREKNVPCVSLAVYKACCYAAAKTPLHLLGLDSLHEVILTKPIGHVDHMALHSLMSCTTQHTFMAVTRTGTN